MKLHKMIHYYPEHGIWTDAALEWLDNNPELQSEIIIIFEEETVEMRKALYRRILKYVFMNDLEDDNVHKFKITRIILNL